MGSHAESSCQESFKMRIILLLTVFATLGLCQRQSPPSTPLTEPPQGQRCAGRNFNGPGDGGNNDGHRGCKGDLICGSNNCLQFGAYYHPKDDCCERPSNGGEFSPSTGGTGPRQQEFGWGPWSTWSPCSNKCGYGKKTRQRNCVGRQCGTKIQHKFENQEVICE